MPTFASVNGSLSIPSDDHPNEERYTPLAVGRPLCIEILHWALGDVRDWWGKAEIMSASRAALGAGRKRGAAVLHFIRGGIEPFDYVDQLGADRDANRMIFYTPSYDGKELGLTIQYVELDGIAKKHTEKLGQALMGLGRLAPFAAQLPHLAVLPEVVELGRRVYNFLNDNDRIMTERIDFKFDDSDFNRLRAGRYVVVDGSHRIDEFVTTYRLAEAGPLKNRLIKGDGESADREIRSPYVVFRVTCKERPEYASFEVESAAQEMVEAVLNSRDLSEEVSDLIADAAKAAKEYGTVKEIIRQKRVLDKLGEGADEKKKEDLGREIDALLRRLGDEERATLLTEVLGLGDAAGAEEPEVGADEDAEERG